MKPVTDPSLLEQLNNDKPGLKPVSDPAILSQLEGPLTADSYRAAVKARQEKDAASATWIDNLRDVAAATLKIGPTLVKGVADLGNMVTGDTVNLGVSKAMKEGMGAIDSTIGSTALNAQKAIINRALQDSGVGVTDLPGVVLDNPRAALDAAVSTVGSMALPTGVAAGVARALPTIAKVLPRLATVTPGAAATGASIVTGAAQNAAETFADTEGQSLADRYTGAGISAAASLALGKLLGGGAEGVIARRLAGESIGRGAVEAGKSAVKTGAKEFIQEAGEESSNYVGKQTATGQAIDPQTMGKQGLYGGMIGLGVGGASDVATNAANLAQGSVERQIARAIDQAAQEFADQQSPQTIERTVARILDRQAQAPVQPEQPSQSSPPALGFDPSVRNPQPTMQVDSQGNASPVPADQQASIQDAIERMNSLGLTPDVQRAAAQRALSPEPAPASAPSDLIQRLMGYGWTPPTQPEQPSQSSPPQGDGMVLQNRNRATPSSIAQMTSIAANPDYGRLGFSRDFANGAPVVSGGTVPAKQLGKSDVAVASDGRRIPVQYAVIEADQVLTSNRADGTANADYGNDQVQGIRAIAGNGRIAGLQTAYTNTKADTYRKELTDDALHGIDKKVIKGMKNPVLVRLMPKESLTADIGDVSNTVGNLTLSPVEQAKNDAQRVSLDALDFADDGAIKPETVRQFVRAMPQSEQGGLLDTNGQPTRQAMDRISAAVFSRAYGNDQLVRLYAQAQDPEARLILSALAQVAPKMARLEGAGALDIRDVVTQAAEIAVNARREGVPLAQVAKQQDMTADPLVGEVLDLFARNARSVKPVVQALSAAADMAYTEANKPASDMFGEVPRASRGDVINQLRPENERTSQKSLENTTGREPVQEDAGRQEPGSTGPTNPGATEEGRPAQDQADQQVLSSYTPQDIEDRLAKLEQAEKDRQQQDREAEQRAQADAQRDDFTLTGSDRPADVAASRGQQDIFSQPSAKDSGGEIPVNETRPGKAEDKPAGRIDDFGQKIGGARKDVWTSFKDQLGQVADEDIASQPLSKIWPQPDYQALLDGGADPWGVAFARAARDEITAKPRQAWKVKRWAEQVRSLRETTMKLMDGRLNVERAKQLLSQYTSEGMRDLAGRIELYTLVGHRQSLDGVRITSGEYSIYNGVEYKPARVIWTVEKKAAATAMSNWPRELATGATKEEALQAFKAKYDNVTITPPASKEVSFEVYSRRGQDGYWVGKKIGRNPILLAGPFANIKEARDYKANNQADLVAKLEKSKEIPRERRDTNDPRVGEDMRNGQDVTPQMFGETFGFRGVEFGNWVEQGRRQKDLNEAFDALMDMAAIIGVPPKALSLNGELGLAFGARGGGGVNPASAHYERDKVVINLTKKSGAGSLGHEWWHALDNYFSRMRANSADMMTESRDVSLASRGSPFEHRGAVRKEMVQAFGAVMKAVRETAIKARSAKLDAKRSKEYWTTEPEMSARAFESYLISKLQDQDASNDYLANIVSPETWKAAEALGFELDDSYPYPTAGEIPAIRAGFDEFFRTIQSRETETGLMLYEPEAPYGVELDPSVVGDDAQPYNADSPKRRYTDDRQLQLFLDNGPDPSQAGPRGEAAQRAAVAAVDDLRSTQTLLALALSRDFAARQRASLVGQKVASTEDLAVLAQVYRDPRFETFRVVFTNDAGRVVSQVGLTSRLPGSTSAIMGNDLHAYLGDLSAVARNRGATGYYLLHNHPSGIATPSNADLRLTRTFAQYMPMLEFKSHVVIDTNEYSAIDGQGRSETFQKDFGQPAPMTFDEWGGTKISGPDDVMAMAKRLQVDKNAVTLISLDYQLKVKGVTTIPSSAIGNDKAAVRRAVAKAVMKLQGARVVAVGRDADILKRMGDVILDGIHVDDAGAVTSLIQRGLPGGELFPSSRPTRVSPDTSPEFDYLRSFDKQSGTRSGANVASPSQAYSVQSAAQPWTVPEPGAGDAFLRAIQNNKIDVKRVRDALADRYGKLAESRDTYLSEELYHGRVAARVDRLYEEHVEPILKKIAVAGKNAGVTLDDVNLYLHARHAPERNAAMKAINPNMQNNDALSGMSNQQAAKAMADFKAAGKDKALAVIAADVDKLLAENRTNLVADGLEDAGTIKAWETAYKHYVPLQRDIKGSGSPKGMGFSVRGPESKAAVGSNRQVVNILANIVAQAETEAIRAEKSRVGRALLEMATAYPNDAFWKVDTPPVKPRIDKNTGLVIRTAIDPLYQTAENVVMVKVNGQEHFVVFNKDNARAMHMAHAMKNLDAAPMNKILEVVSRGTRFLASLLTQRNPLFWITNFSRDIQGALLNLEGTDAEGLQRQVMANLPKAFKGMHAVVRGAGTGQWARYANEFTEAGGATGYMQVFENSDKRMDDLRTEVARMQQGKADPRRLGRLALEFIDDYNDIIENAVRLSVFQAARDSGVSTAKAASIAKNITVNFNRKGNLTQPINALYMFFNASVQGTARLVQAVATSKSAQVAVGGIAVMGFVLDALNRMGAGEDDETKRNRYDLIPEFEKSRNWIFMNPMRPGDYVKVPLPLGPHVFHNAGRLLSDAIFRGDKRGDQEWAEFGWSLGGVFLDAFSPLGATPSGWQLMAPSVADPIAQVWENKSFTGAPVYKSAERNGKTDQKPAYTRHFESTPDIWISASKMLNDITGGDKVKPGAIDINPDVMKHVFYAMTGGPGRTLDQTIDTLQAPARGREFNVNRVPLASRFYGTNDDKQRERAFYDDRKRVLDAKDTFDYYIKNGRPEEARRIAEELGDGDAAKGRKLMRDYTDANKTLKKVNGDIRRQMEAQDNGEANAEQLRALRQRRVRVMSNALDDNDDE